MIQIERTIAQARTALSKLRVELPPEHALYNELLTINNHEAAVTCADGKIRLVLTHAELRILLDAEALP